MRAIEPARIDDALAAAVAAGLVPGVVAAVADRGGIRYEGAFGNAAAGRPMTADTVFRIASMTKLVTSVAVLMLRDAGRLAPDAPLRDYLAGYRQPPVLRSFDAATQRYTTAPAARDITIRDLLTHTSGYGYWFLNPELHALQRGAPRHFDAPFLVHDPGARFTYGIGTDVLGQVVEPLSGLPLGNFFAARIFEPLGMRASSFRQPAAAGLAAVHERDAAGFVEVSLDPAADGPRGGGALYSTARDFLALLRLLLGGGSVDGVTLLMPATAVELATNQIGTLPAVRQTTSAPRRSADFLFMDGTQKFGFGVLIETRARSSGRPAGSYGWGGIYNTWFFVDPASGLAAVVFMQMSPFSDPACLEVCERFERALYGGPPNP